MTLVSAIIRDAFRESNLIAISAQPTEAEQDEALSLLNRLLASVYGTEAGEQLAPVLIGSNNVVRPQGYPWYDNVPDNSEWFIPANVRLILNVTVTQTLYLDPNPEDGARFAFIDKSNNLATYPMTINANGRTIAGANTGVFNTNGMAREYMYRADTANWYLVTPLIETDIWPFPLEFDDLFVTGLAMRINPRNSVQADQQSVQAYGRLLRMFKSRYRQHRMIPSELGLLRLTGYDRQWWGGEGDSVRANAAFASGNPFMFWGYI